MKIASFGSVSVDKNFLVFYSRHKKLPYTFSLHKLTTRIPGAMCGRLCRRIGGIWAHLLFRQSRSLLCFVGFKTNSTGKGEVFVIKKIIFLPSF
jgi:hypothetical protein